MQLNAAQCYPLMLSRDADADGRFYVGVVTTGIYCRPICRVRPPHAGNCRFFASAAAAEATGLRPCLRCRPELAPGLALTEHALPPSTRLAADAADAMAVVTPAQYRLTGQLLLAKRLLTDTRMPLDQVAALAGFGSAARMHRQMLSNYRLAPAALRRLRARRQVDSYQFRLDFRPPFDWPAWLGFLSRRTIARVESVDGGVYARTLAIPGTCASGWLTIRPLAGRASLQLTVSASLQPALPAVLQRIAALCDLDGQPARVAATLGELARGREGLRLPGAVDGFEVAVRAVLGQQITVAAARTLAGRFASAFGQPIDTPVPGLDTVFPAPARIAALELSQIASLGVIASRSRTLIALAGAIADGSLVLEPGADPHATITRLCAVPGIGDWTAQYIAMRALRWPDAFPASDFGVMKALAVARPAAASAAARNWQPYRAYAVMHLWASLAGTAPAPAAVASLRPG